MWSIIISAPNNFIYNKSLIYLLNLLLIKLFIIFTRHRDIMRRLTNLEPQQLSQINNYTILKKIAQGSFAKVFQAVQNHTKILVAVKILSKIRSNPTAIAAFQREATIQRELHHPRIVKILETLEDQQNLYIIQQLCPSGDLLTKLQKDGPLSQSKANLILFQIVSALMYLDSKQIYHRDIKPENILIDNLGHIKLCDFGMACYNPHNAVLDDFCGSVAYMSPEMVAHNSYIPLQSDIWSLGVVYYAMITGEMLFAGQGKFSSKQQILRYNYHLPKKIPIKSKELLKLMLAKKEERADLITIWSKISIISSKKHLKIEDSSNNLQQELLEKIQFYTNSPLTKIIDSIKSKSLNTQHALYELLKIKSRLYSIKIKPKTLSHQKTEQKTLQRTLDKKILIPTKKLSASQRKKSFRLNKKTIHGWNQNTLTPINHKFCEESKLFQKQQAQKKSKQLQEREASLEKYRWKINRSSLNHRKLSRNLKYICEY